MQYREKFYAIVATLSDDHENLSVNLRKAFRDNKAQSKQAAGNDIQALKQDLQQLAPQDSTAMALLRYEQNYLIHGQNWATMKTALDRDFATKIRLTEAPQSIFSIIRRKDNKKIGMIFVGDTRFELVQPRPPGAIRDVYVRRHHTDKREYIKTQQGHFVKRLVLRGLNQQDSQRLASGQGLIPSMAKTAKVKNIESYDAVRRPTRHPKQRPQNLTQNEQILSHTRGWWKRFISTTVTQRPAISTRGTEFRSVFGAIEVDCAKLPLGEILDVHTPNAARQVFGFATDVIVNTSNPASPANAYADEKFLAQRDVIRTREVLLKNIPRTAINYHDLGENVLALGHKNKDQAANISAEDIPLRLRSKINGSEHISYDWEHYYWAFFEFDSAVNCHLAYQQLQRDWTTAQRTIKKLHQYVPR